MSACGRHLRSPRWAGGAAGVECRRNMSLRARLMGLVLLATLLPALLLGWRFLHERDAGIEEAVRALATAADSIAADLDHRVQGTAQLHFGLAHSRLLDSDDRAACSAYLSQVREAYPQYTGILTVRPDGRLHCDSLQTGRELNLADRGYFKRVQAGASGVVLEPVFGRLTGNSVLQVVYPARAQGGGLRFMLVASLNLLRFAQDSQQRLQQDGIELLLVNDKGMVMAAAGAGAEHHKPGGSIAGSALFALAQGPEAGVTAELADADGRARIWAVATPAALHDTGVFVLLGQPRQELLAAVQQHLRQDVLILVLSALLLLGGVWLFAEWGLRRQVTRITRMLRRLGSGDLDARIEAPYPRGELGGLMAVLNSTAASLQQQRAEIDALGLRLRQAQKLEAIGTLAGGIAHDFNNILGAILGNLALAQEEAHNGQPTQDSLAQIRRAALRARELVQRISAFGRADTPALAPLAPQAVVDEVLALVRVAMPAGVTLRTAFEPLPGPGLVLADATQLHQVLMNLCSNAWQALQGAPGTVTVALRPIRLEQGPHAGQHAELTVSDTGCGIDAATCERIFEPYFTTKGSSGGTGLGLSVVHGIVSAHKGSITVDSQPGRGSRFTICLPLLAEAAGAAERGLLAASAASAGGAAAGSAGGPATGGNSGNGQHILYIDDDEVMGLMFERLLVRAGYRVSCHLGAHAALAVLRADPLACDLVVTDFNMPELSGIEVCRAVAALRADLPTILVSGYISDELPALAHRAGACAVVRKQHVLEELVPAIARALAASVSAATTA